MSHVALPFRSNPAPARALCLSLVLLALAGSISSAHAGSPELLISAVGEAADTKLGANLTSVGDFNGDGFDDIAVHEARTSADPGRVRIFYGGASPDGTPDLTFTGNFADDKFGSALDGVGDMNDDGYDDLIIGAWKEHQDPANNEGRAYIFFGGPTPPPTLELNADEQGGLDFGRSVAGVGDVNGDGYPDAMVGSVFYGGSSAGGAFLYYGGPVVDATADMILEEEPSSHFSRYLAGGDINDDGFADMVIRANLTNRVYVYYGGTTPDSVADLVFDPVTGRPGCGDLNGDQIDDVFIAGTDEMNIFFGGPTPDTIADFTIPAPNAGAFFGTTSDSIGDVNGDGDDDLIVSEGFGVGNNAFVYFGGVALDGIPDFTFVGETGTDELGSGSSAGDFNGDGAPDYVVGAGKNDEGGTDAGKIYVYAGTLLLPSFVDATSGGLGDTGGGQGVAWGDYDNDGDPDLYLSNSGQANKLFRNDGGGSFVDVTSGPLGDTGQGRAAAWADYDNDGDLDLYHTINLGPNKLFRNDGGGTFSDVTSGPLGTAGTTINAPWGDYDNDGDLDLYIVNWGAANQLLRNDGGDTFVDVTTGPLGDAGSGAGAAWGDYDGDGDLDLYLGRVSESNILFRNDGDGNFVDATSGPLGDTGDGFGVAWGDYDNDGDLDLYLNNKGQANKLFRNEGDGTFTDATTGPLGNPVNGVSTAWGDYDGDGDLDLYVVNTSNEANNLFRNDGGGSFVDVTTGPLGDTGSGGAMAWADYDGDGDLDMYFTNFGAANKLLRNDTSAGNHWLQVDLQGTVSNRSGIGAQLSVEAGGVTQVREISGGSGYGSQNELTTTVGLGSATTISQVQVRWPNGVVQDVSPPAIDGSITVIETNPLSPCCLPNGCIELTSTDCLAAGGTVLAEGTTCTDNDFDHDGVPDGCDECPLDPDKVIAGDCGCGTPDNPASAFATEFGQPGFGDGEFNLLTSLALDAAGNIFALQLEPDEIQVFGPDGTYLREEFSGGFTDIDIDATGRIHAIAGNSVVVSGEKFTIGGTGSGEGQFDSPIGLALDPDGNIWVSDTGNDRIQGFDRFGGFIRAFGTSGSGNGQLDRPYLIFADTDRIYVAERDNHRVQVFDKEGNSLFTIGGPVAGSGDGQFDQPTAVAADAAGRIYVTDTNNDRVQVFDDEGNFLSEFGSAGTGDGQFGWAWDLAISRSGRLWVSDAEAGFERVQGFDPAPQTLNFSASDGILEVGTVLTWSPICNSDALWRIRRTGGPSGTVQLAVLPQADSTYVDATGLPTVVYDYELTFIDQNTGFEKSENDNGHRTIFAPTNLTATDQTREDAIELRWNDKSSIEDSTRIYRRVSPPQGGFDLLVTLGPDFRVYLDSTAVLSSRYEYCVEAATANGEVSTQDCGAVGELGALNAPGNVRASNGTYTDRVRIEWEDLTLLEEGFNVYRRPAGTQDAFTLVGTADADSVYFEDTTGLGSAWQYGVTAFYNDGSLIESPRVLDDGIGGPETMLSPGSVTATKGDYDDRVFLSWIDPGDDEDRFEVYREDDEGTKQLISEVQASVTQFNDLDAPPGESREYCVISVSDLGGSSPQDSCDVGTRAEIVPPIDLLATDGDFENQTILTWDTESTTTIVFKVIRDGVVLHVLPGSARTYSDKTGQSGVNYTYHVQGLTVNKTASDTTGGGEEGLRQLKLPTDLEATKNLENAVDLTWRDESTFETGYHIFRRAVDDVNPPTLIAELPRNRTSYSDKSGDVGVDYEYHVAPADPYGTDAAPVVKEGRRDLLAVTGLAASDGEFEEKIVVQWNDESAAETAYEIWRDGVLLSTQPADTETYEDLSLAVGVSHSYEVFPVDNDSPGVGPDTPPAGTPSDLGSTEIQAPASVNASDSYTDKVTVSWVDRSDVETGFEIGHADEFGNRTSLGFVGANVTTFDDPSPLGGGEDRRYFVRTVSVGDSSSVQFDRGRMEGPFVAPLDVLDPSGFTVSSSNIDAIDVDGDVAAIGGTDGAGVQILRRDGDGVWSLEYTIPSRNGQPADDQALQVRISGDNLAVIWNKAGVNPAEFYRRNGSTWDFVEEAHPTATSVDMDGDAAVFGRATSTVFWRYNGADWDLETTTVTSLAVATDGTRIAFSASSDRDIFVYVWNGTSYVFDYEIAAVSGNSLYAESIDISGDYLTVGSGSGDQLYVFEKGTQVTFPYGTISTTLGSARVDGEFIAVADATGGYIPLFQRHPRSGWVERRRYQGESETLLPAVHLDGGTLQLRYFQSGPKPVYFAEILTPPGSVSASDNEFENKIKLSWVDRSTTESSFNVLRDGDLIAELPANSRAYTDFDALPGVAHKYEIVVVSEAFGEFTSAEDLGRRPADGVIGGRVTTRTGTGVQGIEICLDPPTSQSLFFDGNGGHVIVPEGLPLDDGFTIEMWATVQDLDGGVDRILWTSTDGDYLFGTTASGVFVLQTPTSTFSYSLPSDRDWHHYAVTVTSGDTPALYVDGAFRPNEGSRPDPALTFAAFGGGSTTTVDLALGGDPAGSFWWSGQMDDVRVWSTVLTEAEIDFRRTLRLDPAADDLHAYLTLDEPSGLTTSDLTRFGRHGLFVGGVGRSEFAAPIALCATTDDDGNYVVQDILYGDRQTFDVTPNSPASNRRFSPRLKSITLDQENPVANEVGFTDDTSFEVSGNVAYEGTLCDAAEFEIYVDGEFRSQTDAEGDYELSLLPGDHTIAVQAPGLEVSPAERSFTLDANKPGQDFRVTTKRRLTLSVGGGCPGIEIGDVTIEVRSDDGCFVQEVELRDTDSIQVPPLTFRAEVTAVRNAPGPLTDGQIREYFEFLGPQILDLTEEDVSTDFVYRAPIKLEITGLPPYTCGPLTGSDNEPIDSPDALLSQGQRAVVQLSVFEDYGNGNTCPVDSATITILDEVNDLDPITIGVNGGIATYSIIGGVPNPFPGRLGGTRSFQKTFTAVAEAGGNVATEIQWVLVEGARPRSGTFYSAITDEFPVLILHDPPGDDSFATWAEGESQCMEFADITIDGDTGELDANLQVGAQWSFSSFGIGFNVDAVGRVGYGHRHEASVTDNETLRYCVETTRTFSTSDDDLFVGPSGDIFVGSAMNVVFAPTDNLKIDESCQVSVFESIRFGLNDRDPFATTFAYTRGYIENVLVPRLSSLAISAPDSSVIYNNQVETWTRMLARADSLATVGIEASDENRSFSAGAIFEASSAADTTKSTTMSHYMYTDNAVLTGWNFKFAGTGTDGNYVARWSTETFLDTTDVNENRVETTYTLSDDDIGDFFTVDIGTDPVYGTPVFDLVSGASSCPWEEGTTPRDGIGLEIGALINGNTEGKVPADEPAIFELTLTNTSTELREYYLRSEEIVNEGGATIRVNGADAAVPKSFFVGPATSKTIEVSVDRGPRKFSYPTLRLQAIPPCEFELFQAGDTLRIAESVDFSVDFEAPCSDITISQPESGDVFNKVNSTSSGDMITIELKDFVLKTGDGANDLVEGFNVEYRRRGSLQNWDNILDANLTAAELGIGGNAEMPLADYSFPWDVPGDNAGDDAEAGTYELRAFSTCGPGEVVYSNVVELQVDRQEPQPFGAPAPADGVLALGDPIRIIFDEPIDCATVDEQTVEVKVEGEEERISIDLDCSGNTIVINPASILDHEGQILTVRVGKLDGDPNTVTDLAGNPMVASDEVSAVETWSFLVSVSDFVWTSDFIEEDATYEAGGTIVAQLVNGEDQPLDFTLNGLPSWLTANVTGGTIAVGETFEIELSYPDSLGETGIGINSDTTVVFTTSDIPDVIPPITADVVAPPLSAVLDIEIEVRCGATNWVVDERDYEHTMTAVVQVEIPDGQGGFETSTDDEDVIAAFVGDEVRGVANVVGADGLAYLTIHSNRPVGEVVRFQIFDKSDCHLFKSANRTAAFVADNRWGNPGSPQEIEAEDPSGNLVTQDVSIGSGWNWFSLNVEGPDMTIFSLLSSLNAQPGDLIKSQGGQFSVVDSDGEWQGTLFQLNNREGYLLNSAEGGGVVFDGDPADGDLMITIQNGWNWIGYPPAAPNAVEDALATHTPNDFDVIKSQTEFAQYTSGTGWTGSLTTLVPGQGYKLYSGQPLPGVLMFPANPEPAARWEDGNPTDDGVTAGWNPAVWDKDDWAADAGERKAIHLASHKLQRLGLDGDGAAEGRVTEGVHAPKTRKQPARSAAMQAAFELGWSLPQRGFQHNMTMIAQIDLNGAPLTGPAVLGAFVGDEVRGVSEVMSYGLGQSVAFLMIHSDEAQDEKVTFQVLDTNTDQLYEVRNNVDFLADGNLGTIEAPWTLHASPVIGGSDVPVTFQLAESFPNPARLTPAQIGYALPIDAQVEIELFDVQGRSVRTLVDSVQPAGRHIVEVDPVTLTSGIYFYRMRTDSFEQVRKLTVVR